MTTAVIGGGLAGLAAATWLARAGKRVTLFEKARTGGRARTRALHGALFNQGPHALYRAGRAMELLRSLGIRPSGGSPPLSGNLAWCGGRLCALPVGTVSLLTTSLLSLQEKLELARLLAGLGHLDATALEGLTLDAWLARALSHERCREVLRSVVRLASYANHPESISAGAAVRQLRLAAAGNVLYLHGGWQTLVDALRAAATSAGVRIIEGTPAERLEQAHGAVAAVHAGGERLAAREVVLAVPPRAAAVVSGLAVMHQLADRLTPIRAACLDLVLRELPCPRHTFALGIDRPYYFSIHSHVARLGPEGLHVMLAAKYLSRCDEGAAALPELEAFVDAVQPGWREHVMTRRFLPELVVTHAVPTPHGRPPVDAAGVSGLYLCGDWVGPEGMLADAALSSAAQVARRLGCTPEAAA
ncbi:MAG: phytoene desaturase family protein [Myxococcota bacterium]